MKKLIISLVLLSFLALFVSKSLAQTSTVALQTPIQTRQASLQTGQIAEPVVSTTPKTADARVSNLIARADTEITRRITALNEITGKISDIKHITDMQKSGFTQQISTEIANLTALKTKVDADTDLTTLKTDVQSIVTSYRVFALFIPQIRMIAASDKVLSITDTLSEFATKLAGRITSAQNSGQDVTTLQALLTDMQNKIADAKTQANSVITTLVTLTPAGYPGNQSDLQSGRKMLQTARLDLVAALQDGRKIIQTLKEAKPSGTPVASPTGAVSPTISIQLSPTVAPTIAPTP